jgi:Amt family ammonium transporter
MFSKNKIKLIILSSLFAILFPAVSFAEDAVLNTSDTAWIMTSTALVLFMTLPGLALFSATTLGVFSGYGFAEGKETIMDQLSVQLIGVVAVFTFTVVVTFLILKIVNWLVGLRVDEDDEIQGLESPCTKNGVTIFSVGFA